MRECECGSEDFAAVRLFVRVVRRDRERERKEERNVSFEVRSYGVSSSACRQQCLIEVPIYVYVRTLHTCVYTSSRFTRREPLRGHTSVFLVFFFLARATSERIRVSARDRPVDISSGRGHEDVDVSPRDAGRFRSRSPRRRRRPRPRLSGRHYRATASSRYLLRSPARSPCPRDLT